MSQIHEFELRRALQSLPRRREPAADLWPGIAAGIGSRPRSLQRWAMAAGVVTAVALAGILGLRIPGDATGGATVAEIARLDRVADAMMVEYDTSLLAVPAESLPSALRPAADELDEQVRVLREALDRNPESRLLIRQLHLALERRMRLAQRLV